jgi:adenylate kinase
VTRRVALTGTPGTGKSTVARLLAPTLSVVEVGELARRWNASRRTPSGARVVDLRKLAAVLRRDPNRFGCDVVVGHLAHLLPVQDVVVLRCHPATLERRLAHGRRSSSLDRHENVLSEAIGLITAEAVARRRTVFEVDTTRRTPREVTRAILSWLHGPRRPDWGRVDWLGRRTVTEHLLEWTR